MVMNIDKPYDLITEYYRRDGHWEEIRRYYWVPLHKREPVSFAACPGCGRRLNITEAARHKCYGGANGLPRLPVTKPRFNVKKSPNDIDN